MHRSVSRSFLVRLCALALVLGSSACTTPLTLGGRAALLPADILLLGEQHNAPEHQVWEKDTVQWLAGNGALAALPLDNRTAKRMDYLSHLTSISLGLTQTP